MRTFLTMVIGTLILFLIAEGTLSMIHAGIAPALVVAVLAIIGLLCVMVFGLVLAYMQKSVDYRNYTNKALDYQYATTQHALHTAQIVAESSAITAKAAAGIVQMLAEGARVKQLKSSGEYIIIDADGSRYTPEQCQLSEAHLDYMIDQQHLLTEGR